MDKTIIIIAGLSPFAPEVAAIKAGHVGRDYRLCAT